MTTCRFAIDDGAYVLGALSPTERAEFERHLPGCATCRKSVARLAVLPGLLGRLDAETVIAQPAPPTLLPRTLQAITARRRAERRRRRWYVLAGALAAVVLVALAGIGARLTGPTAPAPPSDTVALTAMRPVVEQLPVAGEIGLVRVQGGTRIDMRCWYEKGYEGAWTVRLVVFPIDGGPGEQVGSWMASAGQEISLSAMTHLSPAEIGRIELRRGDDTALLEWSHP